MIVLGIETSCDDTAAAVLVDGGLRSSIVSSQDAVHGPYGGIVPELASRHHVANILAVIHAALEQAAVGIDDVEGVAVTRGPGLIGSLLVGLSAAKGIAFGKGIPLVGVNHLEGHIHAVLLEEREQANRKIEFPVLALVVSGGHTHLYLARMQAESWTYQNIGHTRDDAAGEAFDKVAKLLGLGYPGGPMINQLAAHGNPQAVKFAFAQMKHRDRNAKNANEGDGATFDFSFSGIKTAVLRYVETHGMKEGVERRQKELATAPKPKIEQFLSLCDRETLDLIASFQYAVVEDLVQKTVLAARACDVRTLFVTGGVAANTYLRTRFEQAGAEQGMPVYFPSRPLSTDNAAMIAAAAYPKFLARDFAGPDLSGEAGLQLR